ncbi:MAG: hypothetical protein JWP11_3701 [Frankiales bacterium]|nr:hypothetical protein [Frankiales bacterium]
MAETRLSPHPTRTARDWRARLEAAIRRQVDAEREVTALDKQQPPDPSAEQLRNDLRTAALMKVEAYAADARRCSDAFDAFDAFDAANEIGDLEQRLTRHQTTWETTDA